MGRRSDPVRKAEILAELVDYAFENGLSDFSLRPVADALGTSPRMLLYHFGSKEQLLVETVQGCRDRQYRTLEQWEADEESSFEETVRRFWEWITSEEMRSYLDLFFEIFGLSLQQRAGFGAFAEGAVRQPLDFFEQGFRRSGSDAALARVQTTLFVATVRGLLMDFLATGDRERVMSAFEEMLDFLFRGMAPGSSATQTPNRSS